VNAVPQEAPARAPLLGSFGQEISVAVIGAGGGLGKAFIELLAADPAVGRVAAFSRSGATPNSNAAAFTLDLEREESIAEAADQASAQAPFNLVLVASGILHDGADLRPEKSWRHLDGEALARAFRVNATGPALVAKHFLPLLAEDRKSVFAALSARVGSIEDNRFGGWHAYRASKAALNMLIRTLAVELARRNPTALCVGLHPGTVDTRLSAPFQRSVPEGKLFSPAFAAGSLLGVLDGLAPKDSGGLFAWDGARIPF
jgi:NAD(P)-dependent dehydrogenase (short-subunit alcohol dehydrogenase family)